MSPPFPRDHRDDGSPAQGVVLAVLLSVALGAAVALLLAVLA